MFNEYESIHVVGCGPSARDWLDDLRVKPNVIGVNSMGPVLNPPFWLMIDPIVDSAIIQWAESAASDGSTTLYGTKFNKAQLPQQARIIKTAGNLVHGDPDRDGYFMIRSSLVCACHVAWKLGAERVIVWGLDMNDHARTDGSSGDAWRNMETIHESWRRLRVGLRDLGCEVFNANPWSGIRELEFIDPGQAIGE